MGYLNICVGRDREFDSLFRIFEGAATKGVIIVGQPGVGKSAIIDGLAQKMVGDDVPAILKEKRLVSLSISRLVAGASASEAQERMMIAINEIVRARNIILVVDNVHDIMGISAGGEQSLDLSEVLAEAISKNLLILIGTTDDMNYSRYVERTTLGGILQKIELDEVDINGAIQVLESKVGGIENQNGVFFSYGALEAAAKLTDRYVNDRFLPSKAIKLIEEVAVYVKNSKGQQQVVTREDVAKLLSEKINIPVSDITTDESAKLLNLESILHGRVIGQDEAVKAVSTSLRRARTELRESNRPIANLLFLGPTGVGKTELTKAIAHEYFGSEDRMVRIDMSEYQEQSSISKLIGAPPGAGGAATLGQLTEAVRKNPFSIVLLDEMEKAHPDILNLFLQVMEDGRLTDATGNTIDFTNAIVIATSNAGSQYIQDQVNAGTDIETIKQGLLQEQLKDYFRPEFINRFDNVIVFKPLQIDEIRQIARLMLNKVAKQLEEKGIHFRTSDEAVAELAQVGFDPQFGARPLRRAVQDTVDNALAEYLLQGKISRRDIAVLEPGGKISIEKAEEL
jgi:ATP-dependent Clp protease ATP-binding subunit ClpC